MKQVVKAVIRMQRDVEEWEVVSKWCSCNFTGEESFNEVKVKLKDDVNNIMDYFQFLMEVPLISDLLSIVQPMDHQYVCVTLIMSFKAFRNYCRRNNIHLLDESYLGEEAVVGDGDNRTVTAPAKEQEEAEADCKETFYEKYFEKFSKMKNTTLITQKRYNRVVETPVELQRIKSKGYKKHPIPRGALKFNRIYELKSNINQ